MGVHISFVRSIQLDSWTVDQMRLMKVGGNGAAKEFLKSFGPQFDDAKSKYTSRQMNMYKDKLAKLVKEDISQYLLPLLDIQMT
jgi:ADP-ribosylation factor GTPase-activating protein 2/3